MRDEKQETIEDIVSEMREYESTPPPRDAWLDLADRVEAAWRAECERAEAMRREKRGNAAKIREAYEFAEEFLRDYGTDWKLHNKLCDMLKSALAAPLRNCDLYTVGEALRKYGFPTKIKPWGEKEWLDFCEWLMSEVEAETEGE